MDSLFDRLQKETKGSLVKTEEPMCFHTSFRTGGPAEIFIDVSPDDIPVIISIANEFDAKITVIGNGSNVLVGDKGISGIVLCFGKCAGGIEVSGNSVYSGSGELLSSVSKVCANNGLSGLEFASGIPGSIGGGVFMNAGAYGGEISDVIKKVSGINIDTLKEVTFENSECGFSYRNSVFMTNNILITSVEMLLTKGDRKDIYAKIEDFNSRRKEKQPIEYPSAGSTFKRPPGMFAGELVEKAGMKGYTVGGASVSEKHAGFIINSGKATSNDIKTLIEEVQKKVLETFGVVLEREVRFVGKF